MDHVTTRRTRPVAVGATLGQPGVPVATVVGAAAATGVVLTASSCAGPCILLAARPAVLLVAGPIEPAAIGLPRGLPVIA